MELQDQAGDQQAMSGILQRMSEDLLLPPSDLEYLARSAPYRYKVYQVAKKQPGKTRTIAQPSRAVKGLQYWVISNVLKGYPVHRAAAAYRRGKGILDNAKPHCRKRYLLKLDFRDFFHSIRASDFKRFNEDHGRGELGGPDLEYLTRILFWRIHRRGDLVLSIGAPSSPALSNILMYDFDCKVADYCRSVRVTYTRYADDLTFSASQKNLLGLVETRVQEICSRLPYPRLRLNPEKRVHASRATSRRVTGLVLSNEGSVSIGHERKRKLRAAVHHFARGKLTADQVVSLAGTLAFVHSVEPQFLHALARKYGRQTIKDIMKASRPPQVTPPAR